MEKTVTVSKEMVELMDAVVELVKVTKQALADGFQMGQDVGPILSVAIAKLPVAVDGVDKLGEEMKKDPQAFANAVALGASELLALFVKKEAAPQA